MSTPGGGAGQAVGAALAAKLKKKARRKVMMISGTVAAPFAAIGALVVLFAGGMGGATAVSAAGSQMVQTPNAGLGPASVEGIPPIVLAAYIKAAAATPQIAPKCTGMRWSVIAGIGKVESNHTTDFSARFGTQIDAAGNTSPRIIGPALDGSGIGGNTTPFWDTDRGLWDEDGVYDHAVGPTQFIPSSWRAYGQDGNGDGIKDPHNIYDATLATAAHLCGTGKRDLRDREQLRKAILSYNNAGWYADKVLSWIDTYDALPDASVAGSGSVAAIIAWAQAQLGTAYHYSGDCSDAHSADMMKHCDCSSLTLKAYERGAGLSLPRTTYDQIKSGPQIPIEQVAPGDLLFPNMIGNPAPDPSHVGLYVGSVAGVGDDVIIHARKTGSNVEYSRLHDNGYWSASWVTRPKVLTDKLAQQKTAGGPWVLPVSGYSGLSARFHDAGAHWSSGFHTGLDFVASQGTPVRAVGGGQIVQAGPAGAYGNRVVIRHSDGTETWYCHLSVISRGLEAVQAGDVIGRVGATGNVTGPHLHFEVRPGGGDPVDPDAWLRARGLQP